MFVSGWMTKQVFTVTADESISDAISLMKERGIRHLPVMAGSKLKGMVSDRDIRDFSPSKSTSLDIYELHYIFAKTKIRSVMKTKVVTASPDTPIEEAAMLLYDNNIGCLPVVEGGRLAGIISDRDIFRALIDITGVRHGGHRVFVEVEDRPGSIKEVADIMRKHGFSLQSILTSYEKARKGQRHIVIRMKGRGDYTRLKAELEGVYTGLDIRKG